MVIIKSIWAQTFQLLKTERDDLTIAKETLKYPYNSIKAREPQAESLGCPYLRCFFCAFPIMAERTSAAAAAAAAAITKWVPKLMLPSILPGGRGAKGDCISIHEEDSKAHIFWILVQWRCWFCWLGLDSWSLCFQSVRVTVGFNHTQLSTPGPWPVRSGPHTC